MDSRIDKNCINLSQNLIRKKIISFLTLQQRSVDLIKEFQQGYCNGLAVLAIYGSYLQYADECQTSTKPKDDLNWLMSTLRILSEWNEVLSSLSAEQVAHIERFIALIEYFQHVSHYLNAGQGELQDSITDTRQRSAIKEYSIGGLFTAAESIKEITIELNGAKYTTSLLQEITKYEQRLILISSTRHTLGLFRKGDRIFFFNANHTYFQYELNRQSLDMLAKRIFKAYHYDREKPSPIGFRIFTFEHQAASYADPVKLLEAINGAAYLTQSDYAKGVSALHIAASVGNRDCVKYYLSKGAYINNRNADGSSPLYHATKRRQLDSASYLAKKGADIYCKSINKHTPLQRAARDGKVTLVRTMLESKKRLHLDNLFYALRYLPSDEMRKKLITTINPNKIQRMLSDQKRVNLDLQEYKVSRHFRESIYEMVMKLLRVPETTHHLSSPQ